MTDDLDREVNKMHRKYFASVDRQSLALATQQAELAFNAANHNLRKAEDGVLAAKTALVEAEKAYAALVAIMAVI